MIMFLFSVRACLTVCSPWLKLGLVRRTSVRVKHGTLSHYACRALLFPDRENPKTRWVILTPHWLPRRAGWKHGMKTIVEQLGTRRAENENSDHRTTQGPSCTAIPINPTHCRLSSLIHAHMNARTVHWDVRAWARTSCILRADKAIAPERPWFAFFYLISMSLQFVQDF
jgi:hypothetical protein